MHTKSKWILKRTKIIDNFCLPSSDFWACDRATKATKKKNQSSYRVLSCAVGLDVSQQWLNTNQIDVFFIILAIAWFRIYKSFFRPLFCLLSRDVFILFFVFLFFFSFPFTKFFSVFSFVVVILATLCHTLKLLLTICSTFSSSRICSSANEISTFKNWFSSLISSYSFCKLSCSLKSFRSCCCWLLLFFDECKFRGRQIENWEKK